MSVMSPSRPYLVRALHQWILDNQCTPYILVDTTMPNVSVPEEYVENGQIVLNISPSAIQDLLMDDDGISFNARFGGVPMAVFVPTVGVLAIYAKENGQGMMFGTEPGAPSLDEPPTPPEPPKPSQGGKPSLKIVK